jgi:hypothetical protein
MQSKTPSKLKSGLLEWLKILGWISVALIIGFFIVSDIIMEIQYRIDYTQGFWNWLFR